MAILLGFLLRSIFILLFINCNFAVQASQSRSYCDETPHPHICNTFFMINVDHRLSTLPENLTAPAFRTLALRVTKAQARQAHRLILSMNTSLFDGRATSAWRDCLELYEDSVELIEQAINTKDGHNTSHGKIKSMNHIQTYLSAAIANQETCKNGFLDVRLYSYSHSLSSMLRNFTKLLSNTLAIHRYSSSSTSSSVKHGKGFVKNDFPVWMQHSDRRLVDQPKGFAPSVNLVVDKKGYSHFKTIGEAILASTKLRKGDMRRFVIHVKAGVYFENVEITKKMKNLMLIGDGIDVTVITANRNVVDGYTTFRSATFAVVGEGFIAKDITFENTAGAEKQQAVALRSGSDMSVFYKCSFKGYQDTLYVHSKRQFYRGCDVYGTVDFIFGDAAVLLQSCNIYARKPAKAQKVTVTAQGRSDPNENTGIVIQGSYITASPELKKVEEKSKTMYMGRPWRKYSRTVIMKCFLDSTINPQGWLPWSGRFALDTLYYGEYVNTGPGANIGARVNWRGYHGAMKHGEALQFTAGNFLDGDLWIPASGAPYVSEL